MTSLRAKDIRDLAIRGRATRTQQSYTSYVADLARHYRRSPDQISYEEVADWLHHLIKGIFTLPCELHAVLLLNPTQLPLKAPRSVEQPAHHRRR